MSPHVPLSATFLFSVAAVTTLALCMPVSAIGQTADVTLATLGDNKITNADYEASILRIPEKDRLGWAMGQDRINKEVENLLQIRSIAAEARRKGLDNNPTIKARVALYAERLQAEAILAQIDEESMKEFDAKPAIYIERAREQYLINKQQYQTQPEVKASHILVGMKGRTPEEALAKARELRARLVAGESFEKLAEAMSDDPTAKGNKGSLGFFGTGSMDPAFETAVFAMKTPGELSEPVKTQFGYHVIRLDEIRPSRQLRFEEVSGELLEKLKTQFLENRRTLAIRALYDPARIKWNEPAMLGLKKTVDPVFFKVPTQ